MACVGVAMFGKLKGMFSASEATGIVKQAFRALPLPLLPFDPEALATRLVAISYSTKPDLFEGKLGKPPRAITTAAVSLAGGLTYEEYEFGDTARQCVFLALGSVLLDAQGNAARYGFAPVDAHLLRLAENAYLEHAKKTEAGTTAVLGGLGL